MTSKDPVFTWQNTSTILQVMNTLLTSASASIFSSLTIFSTMRSARGRNMVWESFSSCAEMACTTNHSAQLVILQEQSWNVWNVSDCAPIPASPDSWLTKSSRDSSGQFYTRPYLPAKGRDAVVNILIIILIVYFLNYKWCTKATAVLVCRQIWTRKLLPAASSYTPPHERRPWRGESDTPRWAEPSSLPLRTASQPTPLFATDAKWDTESLQDVGKSCVCVDVCVLTAMHLSVEYSERLQWVVISGL